MAYDTSVSSPRTFADVLAANETYAEDFPLAGLQARHASPMTGIIGASEGHGMAGQTDASRDPELQRLRDSIDNIDAALIHLLAERFKCTQQVGHLKAAHRLPPADPAREATQIARLRKLAESARLDPEFAEKFLAFIVKEVIHHHEAIARS